MGTHIKRACAKKNEQKYNSNRKPEQTTSAVYAKDVGSLLGKPLFHPERLTTVITSKKTTVQLEVMPANHETHRWKKPSKAHKQRLTR